MSQHHSHCSRPQHHDLVPAACAAHARLGNHIDPTNPWALHCSISPATTKTAVDPVQQLLLTAHILLYPAVPTPHA